MRKWRKAIIYKKGIIMDVVLIIVGIIVASFVFNLIIDFIFGPSELSSDSDDALLYLIFFTDIFDSHHNDD